MVAIRFGRRNVESEGYSEWLVGPYNIYSASSTLPFPPHVHSTPVAVPLASSPARKYCDLCIHWCQLPTGVVWCEIQEIELGRTAGTRGLCWLVLIKPSPRAGVFADIGCFSCLFSIHQAAFLSFQRSLNGRGLLTQLLCNTAVHSITCQDFRKTASQSVRLLSANLIGLL